MDWANNRALFCQLVECVCMSVSLSASVYSAGWYRVCISRCWLPMVYTSCTYPAGSKGLVVLAVMDCWRKSFNIRLTGITGLKPGVGLRGRGNALKENGKKKTDPTENDELRRCVYVCSLETIHSSCKGYWYKNNRLWNISTEKLGALRWNIHTVPEIRPAVCVLTALVCGFLCLRVCGSFPCAVFLRFPHSKIALSF